MTVEVIVEGVRTVVAGTALVAGTLLLVIGAVGVVRLPDVYCRAHALGKAVTLGVCLLLLGYWVDTGAPGGGLKVLLAVLFQFATLPVASHLLAVLAWRKGVRGHRPRAVSVLPKPEDRPAGR